jgi:hypothetical protein
MKSYLNISFILLGLLASACFDEKDITSLQSESFVKYFNNYTIFSATDVKQVNGQGYALLGTVENSIGITQICLIRTNEYGNTVDSARYYGKEISAKAYCLQVLPDGGFAILGSGKNPVTSKLQVYFIRTNEVGDTLWTKNISSPGNVEAKYFEVNSQGSFIMTGYAEKSDVESQKQVWIGALDKDGNSLYWSPKMYGAAKDDEGRHLQILEDGSFIITGTTKSYPTGTLYSHAFILKATATGGATIFSPLQSSADEEGNCIRAIDNENFLVIGTSSSTTSDSIILKQVNLVDYNLQTQWEKKYKGVYGQSLITEGSSIYLLGTTATGGTFTAISLIITDSNGNNPKYSTFGLGSQLSGSSFEKTSDNGFIISGTNKHSENSKSATLIKTRANGSL